MFVLFYIIRTVKNFLYSKSGLICILASPVPFAAVSEYQLLTGFSSANSLALSGVAILIFRILAPNLNRLFLSVINTFLMLGSLALINYLLALLGFDFGELIVMVTEALFSPELLLLFGPMAAAATIGILMAILSPVITLKKIPTRWLFLY